MSITFEVSFVRQGYAHATKNTKEWSTHIELEQYFHKKSTF